MDQQEPSPQQRKRFERFVKAFEESSKHSRASAEATRELLEGLCGEEDSLAAAIDELIDEVRGLRADLRDLAKANGLGSILGILRGR